MSVGLFTVISPRPPSGKIAPLKGWGFPLIFVVVPGSIGLTVPVAGHCVRCDSADNEAGTALSPSPLPVRREAKLEVDLELKTVGAWFAVRVDVETEAAEDVHAEVIVALVGQVLAPQ